MITYKEFRPTPYDRHLYIDDDREADFPGEYEIKLQVMQKGE